MKRKRGSTLVILVVIIAIITTIGFALIGISYNEYRMSVISKNKDKAYYSAEAAVEKIAMMLDKKVVELQEAASREAEARINSGLTSGETYGIVNSEGNINTEAVDALFSSEYINAFYTLLDDTTGFFRNVGNQENLNYLMDCKRDSMEAALFTDDEMLSKATLLSASYDQLNRSVTVLVRGDYLRKVNDIDVPYHKLSVSFSILSAPEEIPFKPAAKTTVSKPILPKVLSKTILTEKNLVSAGGKVDIMGDVLAFGTIPMQNGKEPQNAEGLSYGGIMAGIPNTSGLSLNGSSLTFDEYYDFDTTRTGTMVSGSISIYSNDTQNISGNGATMGYIHTLYSTYDSPSQINIQGNAYARSIKTEVDGIYSTINLGNAYTSDNLQIDSDESLINVNGAYYGFVTASYDINGSGNLGSALEDSYNYKNTSSIVINGGSRLRLNGTSNGGVFVGGTSFFGTMVDTAYYPKENRPYMTGISALRAGARISSIFEENNSINGETRLYTSKTEYLSGNEISMESYSDISDPSNISVHNMLSGSDGSFILSERAEHFRGLWENIWSRDEIYNTYVDTDAISITLDSDNKINGYAFGSIVANGKVFGQGDYKGIVDAANFGLMQKGTENSTGWIEAFHSEIGLLLADAYDRAKPKLDYISNTKRIVDYLDSNMLASYNSPVIIYSQGMAQGIMYYSPGDCSINYKDGEWLVNGIELPLNKGIIISSGNIYIEGSFNFTGAILSSKNIVFTGNSNISYERSLLENMLLDVNLAKLFKQTSNLNSDTTIGGQRISQKNIRLIKWTKLN